MEHVSARAAPVAPEVLGDARAQLDALLRQIASGGTAAQTAADRLPAALKSYVATAPPSDASAHLRMLIDGAALDGHSDSAGLPCRAALIQAQLALGFPFALEVNPDDLTWLRTTLAERDAGPTAPRIWTAVLALVSLGWSGLILDSFAAKLHGTELWLSAPFWVGGLHALVALVVAAFASPKEPLFVRRGWGRAYRVLSKAGWLGPGFTAIAIAAGFLQRTTANDPFMMFAGVGLLGLFFAAPAMLTAFAAGVAGNRLVPEDKVVR